MPVELGDIPIDVTEPDDCPKVVSVECCVSAKQCTTFESKFKTEIEAQFQ